MGQMAAGGQRRQYGPLPRPAIHTAVVSGVPARAQMATTLGFHIIPACMGIALPTRTVTKVTARAASASATEPSAASATRLRISGPVLLPGGLVSRTAGY